MQMNPYLSFKGDCEEAFPCYERVFGGTLGTIFRYAGSPMVFGQLASGGRVVMALEQTFWAARFGHVVDRFGIPWLINCESADA